MSHVQSQLARYQPCAALSDGEINALPADLRALNLGIADWEREGARWHPKYETLELAAVGAAKTLGPEHSATKALAQAARQWTELTSGTRGMRSKRCVSISAAAAAENEDLCYPICYPKGKMAWLPSGRPNKDPGRARCAPRVLRDRPGGW